MARRIEPTAISPILCPFVLFTPPFVLPQGKRHMLLLLLLLLMRMMMRIHWRVCVGVYVCVWLCTRVNVSGVPGVATV